MDDVCETGSLPGASAAAAAILFAGVIWWVRRKGRPATA